MLRTRSFLNKSHELQARGLELPFEEGRRVARGYADLGIEEFQLIGSRKTVSLFTGKQAEIPEDHQRFFFRVPELEDLIEELLRRGITLEPLEFRDQRSWVLRINVQGLLQEFSNNSLEEVFLDALLAQLPPVELEQRPPRLKTEKE